jgi:hypothetical protein
MLIPRHLVALKDLLEKKPLEWVMPRWSINIPKGKGSSTGLSSLGSKTSILVGVIVRQ